MTSCVRPATPEPVVAAAADAVGVGPNNPPMELAMLPIPLKKELVKPPMIPNAESIAGTPVLMVPRPPVAYNVDPGNCGSPSLARIYGSVGSAPVVDCTFKTESSLN